MTGDGGRPLRVVQVARVPQSGGAERIAWSLHKGLLARGHHSWLAATKNERGDPSILKIPSPPPPNVVTRALRRVSRGLARANAVPGIRPYREALRFVASPRRFVANYRGRNIFDYPGTAAILDLPPERLDVIHLHNLHGRYFDLRELTRMSKRVPVTLTLHDQWAFTGHCAYSMGCERWRVGCGACPDLTIYPAIPRDATRPNLAEKRDIYERSRLYVTAPSRWLLDQARVSALGGAAGWRVIPNGVDQTIFRPGDQREARDRLGLPSDPFILVFTAARARENMFKDFDTVSRAASRIAAAITERRVICLAVGDTGPTEVLDNGEIRFVPYRTDPREVAAFYQAADLYLHAAKADTFPTTILEALSTGLPVVATAVGGIPEEVRSLAGAPGSWSGTAVDRTQATGVLVDQEDADGMAAAATSILTDESLRAALSANAARDAAGRFDLQRQLDETIDWYREIIADWAAA
jgi:glycosyltransferase involved in cell wall biosynthesis